MSALDDTARQIAEEVLDGTGAAISNGNFDAFAAYFELPQQMETGDGSRVIATTHDLRQIFDRFQHHLRVQQATLLERHCISAEYLSADMIRTTHETRIVSGEMLVDLAYPVFSTLRKTDDGWKVIYSQTAFPESTKLNAEILKGA